MLMLLTAAGCVPAPADSPAVAPPPGLKVTLDKARYWPATAPEAEGAEVFPLVPALVVARKDGRPLGPGDEAAARQAVEAHCRGLGKAPPGTDAQYASEGKDAGSWAFTPCG